MVRQVVSVDGVGPGFSEPEFLLDARLRCCEVKTTSGKELKHGLLVAELAFFTESSQSTTASETILLLQETHAESKGYSPGCSSPSGL